MHLIQSELRVPSYPLSKKFHPVMAGRFLEAALLRLIGTFASEPVRVRLAVLLLLLVVRLAERGLTTVGVMGVLALFMFTDPRVRVGVASVLRSSFM